jgi:hypothetical protein
VKDLAEKLGIRAKDVIVRLVVRGVFATTGERDGALLRGGYGSDYLRRTSCKGYG